MTAGTGQREWLTAEETANLERFHAFAERYLEDSALRARVDSGDTADFLADLGVPSVPEGIQVRIVVDTPEVVHFVLPPDPNQELSDESLGAVAGGKTAGSAATAGTASSFACSTIPGTVSSAGTAGTVGSAS